MKKLLLPAALLLSSGLAMAGTASTTLDVSVTVGNVCTVSTAPVNFGTYDSISGNNASGSVTVSCNVGANYSIALDAGANGYRQLSNGLGNYMSYELYDPMGNVWGDNYVTVSGFAYSGASTGTDIFAVNGQLAAGAAVPDGVYSDVVNVVVTY